MKNIVKYLLFATISFQSCNLLNDDSYGGGTIDVIMNGKSYNLDKVTGTEYMGFFCQGNLLGKSLGLGIGNNPQAGDTLLLTIPTNSVSYPEPHATYGNKYCITGSGKVIITKRSGANITGNFYFKVAEESDTLVFENGHFNVEFKPSR